MVVDKSSGEEMRVSGRYSIAISHIRHMFVPSASDQKILRLNWVDLSKLSWFLPEYRSAPFPISGLANDEEYFVTYAAKKL